MLTKAELIERLKREGFTRDPDTVEMKLERYPVRLSIAERDDGSTRIYADHRSAFAGVVRCPIALPLPKKTVIVRLCVWSLDDHGLELNPEVVTPGQGMAVFSRMAAWAMQWPEPLSREFLVEHGFDYA